jgi:anti-sigma regulatory factor (Ser/Thr protein kinase)
VLSTVVCRTADWPAVPIVLCGAGPETARTIASWPDCALAGTAALVATELVANVVRHAHTTMEFTVGLRDGRVCLTVRDGSRMLPRPQAPEAGQAGGRGLQLVRELTDAWGVLPVSDGKVVWTHLTAGAAV